jgi:hypothetical protein
MSKQADKRSQSCLRFADLERITNAVFNTDTGMIYFKEMRRRNPSHTLSRQKCALDWVSGNFFIH